MQQMRVCAVAAPVGCGLAAVAADRKQQIPCGNDNKKGNGNHKGNGSGVTEN